jgi:hypothetical protein
MHRILASAALIAALLGARTAGASPGTNNTTPPCIRLVGSNGSVPAVADGQFTVIVRDLANHPIVGAAIVIDLSGALELHLCADQMDPDAIVDCAHQTVRKTSAADGSVSFTVLGGSNGAAGSTLLGGGKIFSNGTLIQTPTVSAFDLDGSGGVGANDLSRWLGDFATGLPLGRADYDCSGNVGANDLSQFLGVFGSGTMATSCGSSCP